MNRGCLWWNTHRSSGNNSCSPFKIIITKSTIFFRVVVLSRETQTVNQYFIDLAKCGGGHIEYRTNSKYLALIPLIPRGKKSSVFLYDITTIQKKTNHSVSVFFFEVCRLLILNTLNKQLPSIFFKKLLFLLHRFPSVCVKLKWMKPSWFSWVVSAKVILRK